MQKKAFIWVIKLSNVLSYPAYQSFLSCLNAEEQKSVADYATGRTLWPSFPSLLAKAWARTQIGKTMNIDPTEVPVTFKGNQRPQLPSPLSRLIQVSFSNSRDYVVFALAPFPIGVDVEEIEGQSSWKTTAEDIFPREDLLELRGTPEQQVSLKFHQYWSLKEALHKAFPSTLRTITRRSLFRVGAQGKIDFKFMNVPNRPEVRSGDWKFDLNYPTCEHMVAVACKSREPVEFVYEYKTVDDVVRGIETIRQNLKSKELKNKNQAVAEEARSHSF